MNDFEKLEDTIDMYRVFKRYWTRFKLEYIFLKRTK